MKEALCRAPLLEMGRMKKNVFSTRKIEMFFVLFSFFGHARFQIGEVALYRIKPPYHA